MLLCSCTSVLAMKFGCNCESKRSVRKSEQVWVHQTQKLHHGEPSIKWEMKYEMENKLAIVMSNKGSYPKYIKRHTIQGQEACKESHWESGVISDLSEALQITQKWRETKHLWDKERYTHLKSEFQKIWKTDKKIDGGEGPQQAWKGTALDPWHDHLSASWGQPDIVHWPSPCPAPWCQHFRGRPGVYSGTRSVLRSIWPWTAQTHPVICTGFLQTS